MGTRDPHRYLWVLFLIFTPVGYGMALGFHIAKTIRDATTKGTR